MKMRFLVAMSMATFGWVAQAHAHGDVGSNQGQCLMKIGPDTMSFTGYQPLKSREQFCDDIPDAGPTIITLDAQQDGLRDMNLEMRVLRDVGRVLEMPYGHVDRLCKLVPQNPAAPVTLAKAIEGEPKLQAERDANPVVKRAFDVALKLEGLYRHASTHAAGVVISPEPLKTLVPLSRTNKEEIVTQYDMSGLDKLQFRIGRDLS